jgi:hypothetical protein
MLYQPDMALTDYEKEEKERRKAEAQRAVPGYGADMNYPYAGPHAYGGYGIGMAYHSPLNLQSLDQYRGPAPQTTLPRYPYAYGQYGLAYQNTGLPEPDHTTQHLTGQHLAPQHLEHDHEHHEHEHEPEEHHQ